MTSSSSIPSCSGQTETGLMSSLEKPGRTWINLKWPEPYAKHRETWTRSFQVIPQRLVTSLGVWLSAILWPSNRNRNVLAGTPCRRENMRGQRSGGVTAQEGSEVIPVSGCRTLSASLDVSSFWPWSGFRCCPVRRNGAAFSETEPAEASEADGSDGFNHRRRNAAAAGTSVLPNYCPAESDWSRSGLDWKCGSIRGKIQFDFISNMDLI